MTTDFQAPSPSDTSEHATFRGAPGSEAAGSNTSDEARPASVEDSRPSISRQWQTERPPPPTNTSWLGSHWLNRRATNVSAFNEAIWNSNDHDSTTSSSDDDDADNEGGRSGQGPKDRAGYSMFNVGNENFNTRGRLRKDGRLTISVNETNIKGYLAKALGATFASHLDPSAPDEITGISPQDAGREKLSRESSEATITSDIPRPKLNIVVMVIGSRGDIQPFLKLGKNLKAYGHRVRIATHPAFKEFVQNDSGLEFFSVGGDPSELMSFMVKNPGMIPTWRR